jgi:hypothetical protein
MAHNYISLWLCFVVLLPWAAGRCSDAEEVIVAAVVEGFQGVLSKMTCSKAFQCVAKVGASLPGPLLVTNKADEFLDTAVSFVSHLYMIRAYSQLPFLKKSLGNEFLNTTVSFVSHLYMIRAYSPLPFLQKSLGNEFLNTAVNFVSHLYMIRAYSPLPFLQKYFGNEFLKTTVNFVSHLYMIRAYSPLPFLKKYFGNEFLNTAVNFVSHLYMIRAYSPLPFLPFLQQFIAVVFGVCACVWIWKQCTSTRNTGQAYRTIRYAWV